MVKCLKRGKYIDDNLLVGMIVRPRYSVIGLELVGKRCFVHDGRTLIPIRVVKQMVGFYFCSFVPVRNKSKYLGTVIKKGSNK